MANKNSNKKILLSTDLGGDIDDALSMLVMFNHPEINLKGIYTVNGAVDVRAYIARQMANLSGKKTKVGIGKSDPLGGPKPHYNFEDFFVDDSFIDDEKTDLSYDIVYKSPKKINIDGEGLKDITKKLSRSNHILFSIGPLTNIAEIIQETPQIIGNIEKLYIMGFNFSNTHLEFNSKQDSKAAGIVLDSNIPIIIVPKDICDKYTLSTKEFDSLKSPTGKYVKKMAESFIAKELTRNFRGGVIEEILCKDILTMLDINQERIDNLEDIYFAVSEPKEYFRKYRELIDKLKKPGRFNSIRKKTIGKLNDFIPKNVHVHDVFVPYCFLHPEKISTEKKKIICDSLGRSYLTNGEKHQIVTDVDFNHFKGFLKKYLR